MALRPQTFTKGNLVEKHINTAYDVVKVVSDSIADVITASTGIADISTAAGDITSITAVATNIDDVNTLATNINNGDISAAIAAAISTAQDLIGTNADVVLTSADVVTTAAMLDSFQDSYFGPLASDPSVDLDGDPLVEGQIYWNTTDSELRQYDGAAWVASTTLAAASAAAALVSENAAEASRINFETRYLGPYAGDPTLDNEGGALIEGAMYWHSTLDNLRIYDGAVWGDAVGASTTGLFEYTATASQTAFTGLDDNALVLVYEPGFIVASLNGRVLQSSDYVAVDGLIFTLNSGAALNDSLHILSFGTFDIANVYTKAETDAIFSARVPQTEATGAAVMPKGTTAQRPGTPVVGYQRHNTDFGRAEEWNGTSWVGMGGAGGSGGDAVFYENDQSVDNDYTLTAGKNAMSAGPISIGTGVTVTVPTGQTWSVV